MTRVKSRLKFWMYANDLMLAMNAYVWWFHGDAFCGYVAIGNAIVGVMLAFALAKERLK